MEQIEISEEVYEMLLKQSGEGENLSDVIWRILETYVNLDWGIPQAW